MMHSSSDHYAPLTEAEQRALRTHAAATKLLRTAGVNWEIKDPWEVETPSAPRPSTQVQSRAEADLCAYMNEMRMALPIRK